MSLSKRLSVEGFDLHEWRVTEAKTHFQQVKASDSPLASEMSPALLLMDRVQTIAENSENYHDASPEVVQLRKDLSYFRDADLRVTKTRNPGPW